MRCVLIVKALFVVCCRGTFVRDQENNPFRFVNLWHLKGGLAQTLNMSLFTRMLTHIDHCHSVPGTILLCCEYFCATYNNLPRSGAPWGITMSTIP